MATELAGLTPKRGRDKPGCEQGAKKKQHLAQTLPLFVCSCQEAAQSPPKGCSRKMPLHFLHLNGVVGSNTLFSNTSAFVNYLLFRAYSAYKGSRILEHLVWSNTSGFHFWVPLARTNFLSALCGLPIMGLGFLSHKATS